MLALGRGGCRGLVSAQHTSTAGRLQFLAAAAAPRLCRADHSAELSARLPRDRSVARRRSDRPVECAGASGSISTGRSKNSVHVRRCASVAVLSAAAINSAPDNSSAGQDCCGDRLHSQRCSARGSTPAKRLHLAAAIHQHCGEHAELAHGRRLLLPCLSKCSNSSLCEHTLHAS